MLWQQSIIIRLNHIELKLFVKFSCEIIKPSNIKQVLIEQIKKIGKMRQNDINLIELKKTEEASWKHCQECTVRYFIIGYNIVLYFERQQTSWLQNQT